MSCMSQMPGYRSDSPRGYRGEPITGLSSINAVTALIFTIFSCHCDIRDIHGFTRVFFDSFIALLALSTASAASGGI